MQHSNGPKYVFSCCDQQQQLTFATHPTQSNTTQHFIRIQLSNYIVKSHNTTSTTIQWDGKSICLEIEMRLYLKWGSATSWIVRRESFTPMSHAYQSVCSSSVRGPDRYKSISFTDLLPSHRKNSLLLSLHIFRRYTEPVSFFLVCFPSPLRLHELCFLPHYFWSLGIRQNLHWQHPYQVNSTTSTMNSINNSIQSTTPAQAATPPLPLQGESRDGAAAKVSEEILGDVPLVKVEKVLVVGSGGLSIGQAGEFDYSGIYRGCVCWLVSAETNLSIISRFSSYQGTSWIWYQDRACQSQYCHHSNFAFTRRRCLLFARHSWICHLYFGTRTPWWYLVDLWWPDCS